MAARKARWFGSVRIDAGQVRVTVRDVDDDRQPIGSEYEVSIDELSQAESFKACGAVGLNPKNFGSREARLHATQGTILQRGIAVWGPTNAKVVAREVWADETVDASEPTIEPNESFVNEAQEEISTPTHDAELAKPEPIIYEVPDAASDLVGALSRMVGDLAGKSIDEAKVRAIVSQEISELRPHITRVELPTMVEQDIEGRQHEAFADIMFLVSLREHVWLTGPAGTGKTQLAETVAESLGLAFYSIQCNPQMPASQLIGYMNATGEYVPTLFRKAFEEGGVFLFDEIDNSHPSTLAMMNAALSNGHAAFADTMVKRHPDFVCIAAANTWGTGATDQYVGRVKIDAATLDRFAKIAVGVDEGLEEYVTRTILTDRVQADTWLGIVRKARRNVEQHGLRVIVSQRACFKGAKFVAAGMDMKKAAEMLWLAGLGTDDLRKVQA